MFCPSCPGATAAAGNPTAAGAAGPTASAETASPTAVPPAESQHQLFRCGGAAEQTAVRAGGPGAAGSNQPVR